ncbi:amino acid transporter AVT1I-like [Magnolia sinica]|uniref:amino acid transporter AVT1I-like n=1 Tax=Magnolia sinica TaxID=86752 RepID=UPI0026585E96|nr:amino acid transporter AVT1I-like [Magnolia sinica]
MEIHSSTRSPSTDHNDIRPNVTDHVEIKPNGLHFNEPPPIMESQRGTTFLRAVLNGINALSGIGIISIPYALSEGGWMSFILLILVATIFCHTAILLKRCMDADPEIKTYTDIGERALGPKGKVAVAIFTNFELYFACAVFLILEGDNLAKLFPKMDFKIKGLKIGGSRGFVILSSLIIIPTTWLRSLSLLAYISTWGVLTTLIVVASIFWVGAFDGVGFHARGTLCNFHGFPTAMSLFIFSYSCHPVFPTMYTGMKDKRQFSKVSENKNDYPLLFSLYHHLRNNGDYRLPNVWTCCGVSNHIKSPNR